MTAILAALGQLLVAASKQDWNAAVVAAVALVEAVVAAFPHSVKNVVKSHLVNALNTHVVSAEAPAEDVDHFFD